MREMYKRNFIWLRERAQKKERKKVQKDESNASSWNEKEEKMKQIAFDEEREKHFNNRIIKLV